MLVEQRFDAAGDPLVTPGHYSLVEEVEPSTVKSSEPITGVRAAVAAPKNAVLGVCVWDPDAQGIGHGADRDVPDAIWDRIWRGGITLALR